ncbi:uncharacterized protein K489DRAFT_422362, partial [Dissoconium aciculare CBS 342.82]|uniref:Uncharacterized protein n=1 Tax=Dissoconium aciculare CBS 342.82 TaxID=1314786 RepID=A0A6J3M8J7_9PEZI
DASSEQDSDLFIQVDKAEELKKAATEKDGKLVLTVTNSFLHGQAKDGKKRWLVYHDQSRNPFQHRFHQGILKKYIRLGTDTASKMGFYDLTGVTDMGAGLIGDPLRKM